ncbi:imm11 family protein [Cystobacter fuscus]|uniref:imm11 family protein n=1 Tax=Cystobacter fuscus TaxID=43 RepID=UPI0037BEF377
MTMRYFKLSDDMEVPGRWLLGDPTDSQGHELDDPWQFTDGVPVRVEKRLRIPIDHPGKPLDFSLAGVGVTPIVHERAASIFAELASDDVQVIPVDIDGQPGPYCILVATRTLRCIDDHASAQVQYWKPEDGRPDRVGEYRAVHGLRIDPAQVGEARVFRTWGWTVALIVSEDIKEALERAGVTGMKFKEVSGPSAIAPEERERNHKLLELRAQMDAAREAFWRTLGRMEEEVIIPIVVGGNWPARRQVWRVIRRTEGRTLLVTDGLSDFFVERVEPSVGFGLELALETGEPLQDVEKSWPLLLLERVSNEVAEHEQLREKLEAGFLSMELPGKDMPEPLLTKDGRVGVLLGMESSTLPSRFTLPAGEVRLVTIKVLMPPELAYLLEHGKRGRDELVRRFIQGSDEHLSRAWRRSVV